jgi:AraC family transcriptional regulator of adaptative response/methylated-DNA-[protein]-cysteine methyltransferase
MDRDYDRIGSAIELLRTRRDRQPGLEEVSRAAGLSPHHFQRLFRRYTGISPNRYLQVLTLERAKTLLDRSRPLLDTALEAGLSGPGRLHDLFVGLEGVSPGEYKSAGEGLNIVYGEAPSPFGTALLAATPRGVCRLAFVGDGSTGSPAGALVDELRARWPQCRLERRPREIRKLAGRVFSEDQADRPGLHVRGTNFQVQVWRALLAIPAGGAVSYAEVAGAVGRPRAVRAAASAVGANRIAFLIPCHRVLQKHGGLGGYHWGTVRKQAMLAWEARYDPGLERAEEPVSQDGGGAAVRVRPRLPAGAGTEH